MVKWSTVPDCGQHGLVQNLLVQFCLWKGHFTAISPAW